MENYWTKPESGWSDQKLPLPGLSGVRGTLTKQSLNDNECLKEEKLRSCFVLVIAVIAMIANMIAIMITKGKNDQFRALKWDQIKACLELN